MEKCTIVNKVDLVKESVNLLVHLMIKTDFAQLQKDLARRYRSDNALFRKKFELLIRIEKDAREQLKAFLPDLQYYFGKEKSEGSNVGEVAILWTDEFSHNTPSLEQYRKKLESLSQEEYCRRFGEELESYTSVIKIDESGRELTEPIEIIRFLMEMDVPDETKWKLQQIFMNREEHWDRIFAMLEKSYDVLAGYEDEMNEFAQNFSAYCRRMLDGTSVEEYLKESIGVTLDKNEHGVIIVPGFIEPNQFSLMAHGEDKIDTPYYIRMGILYDDGFPLSLLPKKSYAEYSEYMEKVLKLLSDRSKFEILSYIKDKRAYGSELAKQLGLTTATISHHMGALLNAGLVTMEKEDIKVYYKGNTEAVASVLEECLDILTK